ncbi:MAG: methylmalonyl-CoA mutase family protein, partial [Dehalococcoidia bacterium]|nr:methylmalonyl-CoA mutase family protein [Dehalococcoidia bacterium]
NFFEEVAKMRAARKIWARIMREQFGAQRTKSLFLRNNMMTCGSTLVANEPLNNIARVAFKTLCAVMSGCQSLHTSSYDEASGIPSDDSVTIALRTQTIAEHETGVAEIADPLGGSYYVEALTRDIAKQAEEYIARIEQMGGYMAAVEKGFLQQEVADSAKKHQQEIEDCQRLVVGLNKYTTDKKTSIPNFEHDPKTKDLQIQRLRELRRSRDQRKVDEMLNKVRNAARDGEHLMPNIIEAVKAKATLGEVMKVLKEELGAYQNEYCR